MLIAVQGKDELKFMGRDYWNQENKELINQGPQMFNLLITLGNDILNTQKPSANYDYLYDATNIIMTWWL